MKHFLKLLIVLTFLSSCTKDNDASWDNLTLEETYYQHIYFNSSNLVDINNDGTANTNILLELTNYANYPSHLHVAVKQNYTLFFINMPKQEIGYSSSSTYVNFSRENYMLQLENNENSVTNYIIDNENKIISFSKISETQYKLIFQKKYYDFTTMQDVDSEFTIIYELND